MMAENVRPVKIVSFADPLKELVCEILDVNIRELDTMKASGVEIDGTMRDRVTDIVHRHTLIPISDIVDKVGQLRLRTVRDYLQEIGTDLIRKFDPDWHVSRIRGKVDYLIKSGHCVVIDDVRFTNEKVMIEGMGGECFFVVRPDCIDVSNHVSETNLRWQMFDSEHIIINDRSLANLSDALRTSIEDPCNCWNSLTVADRMDIFGYRMPSDKEWGCALTDKMHADEWLVSLMGMGESGYYAMNIPVRSREDASKLMGKFHSRFQKTSKYGDNIGYVTVMCPLIIENLKLHLGNGNKTEETVTDSWDAGRIHQGEPGREPDRGDGT